MLPDWDHVTGKIDPAEDAAPSHHTLTEAEREEKKKVGELCGSLG